MLAFKNRSDSFQKTAYRFRHGKEDRVLVDMTRQRTRKSPVHTSAQVGSAIKGADQVQSLARALSLLNHIADSPDGVATLTDLARRVGLPISTAHRLLITLEQERYVRFNNEDRYWSIGVQAFVTGCGFIKRRSLVKLARAHIRKLMEDSGETVNLAVEEKGEAVFLAQVECRRWMQVRSRPGMKVPMHCSAVGKAIFSGMSDADLARVIGEHGMPRLTGKTITSATALRNELAAIRRQGYAVDDEEQIVGLRCIASPVFDDTGDIVAAVSVSGSMSRIGVTRVPQLGRMVARAAHFISVEMGAENWSSDPWPGSAASPRPTLP